MDMDKIVQDLKNTQWEMADEIERLRKENKKLEDCLREIRQLTNEILS